MNPLFLFQSLDNLQNFYGTIGYPRPQETTTTLPQSLAAELMDTDEALVSQVYFDAVDRGDVDQGDLVKVREICAGARTLKLDCYERS